MKKTILVTYIGGGYSGCFWESNYGIIHDGVFESLKHTGKNGIPDHAAFLQRLKTDRKSSEFEFIPFGDQHAMIEALKPHLAGTIYQIAKRLDAMELEVYIPLVCVKCLDVFQYSPDAIFPDDQSLTGLGGIAYGHTDLICAQCHSDRQHVQMCANFTDWYKNIESRELLARITQWMPYLNTTDDVATWLFNQYFNFASDNGWIEEGYMDARMFASYLMTHCPPQYTDERQAVMFEN